MDRVRYRYGLLLSYVLLLVLVGGCGRLPTPTAVQPTANIAATETAIASRILATLAAGIVTATNTPVPNTPTIQVLATRTATRVPLVSQTITASPTTARPTTLSTPNVTYPVLPDGSLSPTGQYAYPCFQEGSFYEVAVYAKKVGFGVERVFVPFLSFAAFAPGGPVLNVSGSVSVASTDDGKKGNFGELGFGINCEKVTAPNDTYNGKLDVTSLVRAGHQQLAIRFVRSSADLTPISPEVIVNFSSPGRWWLYFGVQ